MWTPPITSLKDGYKVDHRSQYPADSTLIYSNLTPRGSRVPNVNYVISCMFQFLVKRYFIEYWNETFFNLPKDRVVKAYKRRLDHYLGPDAVNVDHFAALHDLGYLPLHVKAIPEGTMVPMRVPLLTIRNTKDDFFWLTNDQETLISFATWLGVTSATTAFGYLKRQIDSARRTGGSVDFARWQNHDFSMRGMENEWAAMVSGAAHLLVGNYGTDTLAAIDFLEHYYWADVEKELVAGSVPATEHSVACMGGRNGEKNLLIRLLTQVYTKGIVSFVSDTYDFWTLVGVILPEIKDVIMHRDGKLVIRPDSGDPVKIICGDPDAKEMFPNFGLVKLLWMIFGGTTNEKGFKQLDPHIGSIYGDSITPERHAEIIARLEEAKFVPENVQGVGSYSYQYVTRDTFGTAMKATFGATKSEGEIAIYKDPKTDSGLKKSAKGLLRVDEENGVIVLRENVSWEDEAGGLLQDIFIDGTDYNSINLAGFRANVARYL